LLLAHVAGWFGEGEPDEALVAAAARLLEDGAASGDAGVQAAGLELASALVRQRGGEAAFAMAREMARGGLRSSSPGVRLRAVRLCLQPGLELLEEVLGVLRDPSAEVRRAAIL